MKLTFKQKRNLIILIALVLNCSTKSLKINCLKNGNIEITRKLNIFAKNKLNDYFNSTILFDEIKYEIRFDLNKNIKLIFIRDCLKDCECDKYNPDVDTDDRVNDYNEFISKEFNKYEKIIKFIIISNFDKLPIFKFVFYYIDDDKYHFANAINKYTYVISDTEKIPQDSYVHYFMGNEIEAYVAIEKRKFNSKNSKWTYRKVIKNSYKI